MRRLLESFRFGLAWVLFRGPMRRQWIEGYTDGFNGGFREAKRVHDSMMKELESELAVRGVSLNVLETQEQKDMFVSSDTKIRH